MKPRNVLGLAFLLFLACAMSVSATDFTASNLIYLDVNETEAAIRDFAGKAFTNTGTTIVNTDQMQFDGGDSILYGTTNTPTSSFTICTAVTADVDQDKMIFASDSSWTQLMFGLVGTEGVNNKITFTTYDSNHDQATSTTSFSAGTEYIVCGVHDQAVSKDLIYINGVNEANATAGNVGGGNKINVGAGASAGNKMTGKIRYTGIWSYAMTAAQVLELFAHGSDYNPYPPGGPAAITVSNIYNGSAISRFTARITNTTGSVTVITTNGTITAPGSMSANISIYNISGTEGQYFNRTIVDWNSSESIVIQAWQAEAWVAAFEKITNTTITTFNSSTQRQWNQSSGGRTRLLLNAGNYNISSKAQGYAFNSTVEVSLSLLENETASTFFGPMQLNITAKDYFSGALVDFNATIYYNGTYYTENLTSSSGVARFYGIGGDYNVSLFPAGYAYDSQNVTLENESQNVTFFLFTYNSVYITFRDEVTKAIITSTTIYCDFISDVFAENYSTNNGTLYVDALSPYLYTIRSRGAVGYHERFYEYYVTNNSNLILSLYLINVSAVNYGNVTATVYDQNRNLVSDAVIKILRYDLETNSYTIREIARTNFEGVADIDLVLYEEFYKFIIEYNGVTKLTTDKTQIYSTYLTFQINVGSLVGDEFYNAFKVIGNVTFDNNSNMFRFDFNDPAEMVTEGCLYVYRSDEGEGSVLVNSSCSSGTSGIIYRSFTPQNDTTYTAYGYVLIGDGQYVIASDAYSFSSVVAFGSMGWFIVMLATLVLCFSALWKLEVAAVLVPLPLLVGSIFSLVSLNWIWAAGLEIIGIIVAYILGRRS